MAFRDRFALLVSRGIPRPLALGALLLLVSLASALLMSPGLAGTQLPELTEEDLGRPFRASSVAGFKASRDFEVADETRTLARREEARSRVRPVFDLDLSIESKVKWSVKAAFSAMREALGLIPVPKAQGDSKRWERAKENAGPEPALRAARKRFDEVVVPPEDEDFAVLAGARFDAEIEQAVLTLVDLAYRSKVVASREELARIDANGITVRQVGTGAEFELATSPTQIMDLREVASELDRFASVPGNLLPDSQMPLRRAVLRLARRQVRVNLSVNIAETEARKREAVEAVKPVMLSIKKGQRLIGDGELVNETHLLVLRSIRSQMSELDVAQLQLGGAGLVALLVSGPWLFFRTAFRRFRPSRRDAAFMALLAVGHLGVLNVWVLISDAIHDRYPALPVEALHLAFPFAAGAMLVRFVLSEECALYFALVFSALAGALLGNSLAFFLIALLSSLVAADQIGRAKDRAGIFRAGLSTGAGAGAVVLFLGLAGGKGLGAESLLSGAFGLISGSFALPMLVLALTPLVEAAFRYASDIKLLELANLNHPALKELVLNAPGTYHHSIVMGSLVESAAEAIGANPLLARSCAYYHDIGKGRNPAYFGENQKGENPHDGLACAMSAMIIKRHVAEGLEMARQYKLPQRVVSAIAEHHGTRLVGFFFHKAQKEAEGKEGDRKVDDAAFRYSGPKPQSRESALVMIADACEAASRSLPEATGDALRVLVQKMINVMFSEGQLDECDLTLKDLHLIAESFTRTLDGIYHARPQYPPGAWGGGKPVLNEVVSSLSVVKGDGPKRAGT